MSTFRNEADPYRHGHVESCRILDRFHASLCCREWTDGVLTACIRKAAAEPLTQPVWVVCDGAIDPEWVEALNSVLDDNRLLTMPNGERVQLTPNVTFLFECDSLAFASPATVSRCAVLYTSAAADAGGWGALAARAAAGLHGSDHADHARTSTWVLDTLPDVLGWLQAHPGAAAVAAPGSALAAVAAVAIQDAGQAAAAAPAACRAIAAALRPDAGERAGFLAASEDWCGGARAWGLLPGEDPICALQTMQPQDGALGGQGQQRGTRVVMTQPLQDALAVTVPWFKGGLPMLLVGPPGSGKRSLVEVALAHIPGVLRADVFCNVQTQAGDIIDKLLQVRYKLACRALPCPCRGSAHAFMGEAFDKFHMIMPGSAQGASCSRNH